MRDGALPAVLLCLALGLWLARASVRGRIVASAALAAVAVPVGGLALPLSWQATVLLSCWAGTVLLALGVYIERPLRVRAAAGVAGVSGLLTGALTSEVGRPGVLLAALPCVLVAWPGAWMRARGWGIALKIAASWLLAIALLSAGLTFATGDPNAGADHLD